MPLPDNYVVPKRQTQEFELFDEGTYNVKIDKIVLKKDQPSWNNPEEKEDKLTFHLKVLDDGKFKNHIMFLGGVRLSITPAFGGGNASWLYKILCAANKIIMTEEQAETVQASDINALEGKVMSVLIKQKPNTKGILGSKIVDCFKSNLGAPNTTNVAPTEDFGKKLEAEAAQQSAEATANPPQEEQINVEDIPF